MELQEICKPQDCREKIAATCLNLLCKEQIANREGMQCESRWALSSAARWAA